MGVPASYREARFSGWASFELRPDAVRVRGAFRLGRRFDALVPPAVLRSEPDWVWVRPPGSCLGQLWAVDERGQFPRPPLGAGQDSAPGAAADGGV